jgi:hypothetical protein
LRTLGGGGVGKYLFSLPFVLASFWIKYLLKKHRKTALWPKKSGGACRQTPLGNGARYVHTSYIHDSRCPANLLDFSEFPNPMPANGMVRVVCSFIEIILHFSFFRGYCLSPKLILTATITWFTRKNCGKE